MEGDEQKYTILQAAKIVGLSKNAAVYRLKRCPEGMISRSEDGTRLLSESGLQWLESTLTESDTRPKAEEKQSSPDSEASQADSVNALIKQLEVKDQQIRQLQDQLTEMQKKHSEEMEVAYRLLENEQKLNLVKQQQQPKELEPIERKKHWWNRRK